MKKLLFDIIFLSLILIIFFLRSIIEKDKISKYMEIIQFALTIIILYFVVKTGQTLSNPFIYFGLGGSALTSFISIRQKFFTKN